ncbi:MAG: hypothetical protein EOM23_06875, partial [Candidatus Moranbacteria bacterium]|nr:hypothetical protein [Candidatus Moranbacteria bacterium]
MKKVLIVVFLVMAILATTACSDLKTDDETVNVIFFTANSGATKVESYLNVTPGSIISEPEPPTRSGFIFLGWFKDLSMT